MPIVAFVGIPGGGASTLTKELSKSHLSSGFWLSEEVERSQTFSFPDDNYAFGLRTWLRLLRVKQLYEAQKLSQSGQVVFVDGYYDKLMHFYLGYPGTSWIMKPDNLYFKATKEIAAVDYQMLPNADVIIGLRLSFDTWICFLKGRGRSLDLNIDFQKECFYAQECFLNAAKQYCCDFNKTYIEIEQQVGKLTQNVTDIKAKLGELGFHF